MQYWITDKAVFLLGSAIIALVMACSGPEGLQGDLGPQGIRGDKGPVGPVGPQGELGKRGPQGVKGDTGLQGLVGSKGDKGDVGLQGSQGPLGHTGRIGAPGPPGVQGLQGPVGSVGPTGGSGEQGVLGPQGVQGLQGSVGERGEQGPTGEKGLQGLRGRTGPQGPIGATGATGATGPEGHIEAVIISGRFKAGRLESIANLVTPCREAEATYGLDLGNAGAVYSDDGSWLRIKSAALCTGTSLTFPVEQSVLSTLSRSGLGLVIQVDMDKLSGDSLGQCSLLVTGENPTSKLFDAPSRYVVKTRDEIGDSGLISIARINSELGIDYPETDFDYSIQGICVE